MGNEGRVVETAVLPTVYQPDWMERAGRRLKMEYVGMGSVFAVIFLTAFEHLPRRSDSAIATVAMLFLFMGLKKKTRDHIAASVLLFIAAALAVRGVTHGLWFGPYALFGACIWAMEGYLEKRPARIYALPVVLGAFAAISPAWILGLAFVAAYLLEPRPDAPILRKRLAFLVAASAILATTVASIGRSRLVETASMDLPQKGRVLLLYAMVAVVIHAG